MKPSLRAEILGGRGTPRLRATAGAAVYLTMGMLLAGCSVWLAPDVREGRDEDPARELLIIHSLAETLSSAELDENGAILRVDDDILVLGNIPNAIARGDAGNELLVTLSGENAVLVLDETTLSVRRRHDLPAGRNPMQSVALGTAAVDAAGLVATTSLLDGVADLWDARGRTWSGPAIERTALPSLSTGVAPQAITAIAGAASGEVRLLVANTAFQAANPPAERFGEGTLTEHVLATADGLLETPSLTIVSSRLVRFGDLDTFGLNPTALVNVPGENELLVVGSGVNLLDDGSGADDGRLIVVDRDTLEVLQSVAVGGSPGSGVIVTEGSGHRLYLAGPEGIRSLYRDPVSGWDGTVRMEYATGGSALALIADIAVFGSALYAADFRENRIIRFHRETDGRLSITRTTGVSQGPVALLVTEE